MPRAKTAEAVTAAKEVTPEQLERLALLTEEMGEAQQAIGKILRFGWTEPSPVDGKTGLEMLETELGDVCYAMGLLGGCGDINLCNVEAAAGDKEIKFKKYAKFDHPQWYPGH